MRMVIEATELMCGQRTITASQMGSGDQTQWAGLRYKHL